MSIFHLNILVLLILLHDLILAPPVIMKAGKEENSEDASHQNSSSNQRDQLEESELRENELLLKAHRMSKEGFPEPQNSGGYVYPESKYSQEEIQKKIKTAAEHIRDIDAQREAEYKKHLAQEEDRFAEKYAHLSDLERAQLIKEAKEAAERHSKHPKVHQPGSQDQVKEHWVKDEGMPEETFNPKLVFQEFDTNGDKVLDIYEVEAILQSELDKVYNQSAPDYDPKLRDQDEEAMRRAFYEHYDKNNDSLITFEEFKTGLDSLYAQNDPAWKTAQEEEDEFKTDEKKIRERIENLQKKRAEENTQQIQSPDHQQNQQQQQPNHQQNQQGQPNVQHQQQQQQQHEQGQFNDQHQNLKGQ